ncbi:MAG: hypothetical protein Q9192_002693 [Flavoplaca navasiana]
MESELRARRTDIRDIGDPNAVNPRNEAGKPKFLTWVQLPEWAKDNEYIQSGFRPISNSYLDCLKSSLEVHNETGNIYTHFFATVWMLALPIYFYPFAKSNYPDANADDWIIFGLYFLGGAICFFLSTAYHVLSNHSHTVHNVYHRLDLLGISTVTAGCFPPGMWYTFPCLAKKTKIYWISLDLMAQLFAATCVLFVPRFRQPSYRAIRGILFSFMASSAFYPIIYACLVHGYGQMNVEAGANRYLLTIITYLTAVTIYATRIPEKWRPGAFDLWGQSHQIFHILMCIGLTMHFTAFAKAFNHTHTIKQC